MNNINTLLSGPWQTAINDEIAILKERISLLQSKKYTLGLLERLDMEELPEEYSNISVDVTYKEQDSQIDEFALTIEGSLTISYEYKKLAQVSSPVRVSVKFSSYSTYETRGTKPYKQIDVDISNETKDPILEKIQEKFVEDDDWEDLIVELFSS